jgi:hypothetical protein
MSIGKRDATRFTRALEGLQKAAGKVPSVDFSDGNDSGDASSEASRAGSPFGNGKGLRDEAVEVAKDTLYLPTGPVRLVYLVAELTSELTPWDYVFDHEAHELQAVLNSASKLYQQVKDETFLGTLALADCVASFLTQERGYSPAQAREIRNRWIYVTISEG